jgi:hypothetical protein
VTDVKRGKRRRSAQRLEVREDFFLRHERGQRFVHEEDPRLREESAAERNALTLAARQLSRRTVNQVTYPQKFDDFAQARVLRGPLLQGAAMRIEQISTHRHMRKQAGFLEDIADAALVRRKKFSSLIVLPYFVADREAARQAVEAGHAAQDGRLAAA